MSFSPRRIPQYWSRVLCSASALLAGTAIEGHAQQHVLARPEAQEAGPEHRFDALRDDTLAKFLNVGPFSIRPHFIGASFYDDNITLAPEQDSREIRSDWVMLSS